MTSADLNTYATTNRDRHAALAGAWVLSFSSPNTARAYGRDLREFFAFLDFGDLDALSAERKHVDLWRQNLTGAPSTVARKLAAVSSFYGYAVDEGVATTNPVARVARPKIDANHSSTQGLTKKQAVALLDAARSDSARAYALTALLVYSGARLAEALNARLGDLQHDGGHRVLLITRKGGKRAKLVLPAQVVDALGTYLGESAAAGTEVASGDTNRTFDPFIFTTATGKQWAASEAFRTIQRLAVRAGVDGHVSPHSLRHTHATLALDAGVALHDLQDSMGHADPRTTRRYDRARSRLEKSSAHALAQVL
jgi:site-specific recombinase XerD